MAKRSANVGLLKPNNAPSVFVSWAKDNKFEIAPELEEKMAEFGLSVLSRDQVIKEQARQLDEYESLIEEVKKPAVAMQETIDILNGVVATKSATIERLKEELADHQASAAAKPTDPRRTRSLHTTLIAVLIDSYGYVPGSKKNKVIADIQNALAERGLEVSADTLRKIIVDSEKHLPAEKAE